MDLALARARATPWFAAVRDRGGDATRRTDADAATATAATTTATTTATYTTLTCSFDELLVLHDAHQIDATTLLCHAACTNGQWQALQNVRVAADLVRMPFVPLAPLSGDAAASSSAASSSVASSSAASSTDAGWRYADATGRTHGPMSRADLDRLVLTSSCSPAPALIWHPLLPAWVDVASFLLTNASASTSASKSNSDSDSNSNSANASVTTTADRTESSESSSSSSSSSSRKRGRDSDDTGTAAASMPPPLAPPARRPKPSASSAAAAASPSSDSKDAATITTATPTTATTPTATPPTATPPTATTPTTTTRATKKRKPNSATSSVYVTGVPVDATIDEVAALFRKAGIIAEDIHGTLRIKLYCDTSGRRKGDALVTYLRPESVPLAITLLDGVEIRPAQTVTVVAAQFDPQERSTRREGEDGGGGGDDVNDEDHRGDDEEDRGDDTARRQGPSQSQTSATTSATPPKTITSSKTKSKVEVLIARQKREQALSWRDEDDLSHDRAGVRIVILKHMFDPAEVLADEAQHGTLLAELRTDIGEELEAKCGPIEKLTIFERHPEGPVAVKFHGVSGAQRCIELMHGRWFGGQRITCTWWDGTNYKIAESDDEQRARLERFGEDLERGEL